MKTDDAIADSFSADSHRADLIQVGGSGDTYRFSNGVCRQIKRVPAPSRLAGIPSAGDPREALTADAMILEADRAAFGIAPPGNGRSGRTQDVVELYLGTPRLGWNGQAVAVRGRAA